MKSMALVLTQSPFVNGNGHDALDMAMVLGSFEIPTAMFFVNSGVNQLRTLQPEVFKVKNYTKSFGALPFYDVEELYVCAEDLRHWGVSEELINADFQILNRTKIRNKLSEFPRIVRF